MADWGDPGRQVARSPVGWPASEPARLDDPGDPGVRWPFCLVTRPPSDGPRRLARRGPIARLPRSRSPVARASRPTVGTATPPRTIVSGSARRSMTCGSPRPWSRPRRTTRRPPNVEGERGRTDALRRPICPPRWRSPSDTASGTSPASGSSCSSRRHPWPRPSDDVIAAGSTRATSRTWTLGRLLLNRSRPSIADGLDGRGRRVHVAAVRRSGVLVAAKDAPDRFVVARVETYVEDGVSAMRSPIGVVPARRRRGLAASCSAGASPDCAAAASVDQLTVEAANEAATRRYQDAGLHRRPVVALGAAQAWPGLGARARRRGPPGRGAAIR